MPKTLISLLMLLSGTVKTNGQEAKDLSLFSSNKQIPSALEKNILTALSFYPELKEATIRFVLKKRIKSSVMQAQPVVSTLLRRRRKRCYQINISEHFKLTSSYLSVLQIPDSVMIGWIGHELGHILDYESRSNAGMAWFGYRYYFHPTFVKSAERTADFMAVERGMGHYIIATKRFILDHTELPSAYKAKIARLYLSPDAILEQVKKLEEMKLSENEP